MNESINVWRDKEGNRMMLCYQCNHIYEIISSLKQANDEYKRDYGEEIDESEDYVSICDNCYYK